MFELKTFGETIRPNLLLNFVLGVGSLAPFKNNSANNIVEIINLIVSFAMFIYWFVLVEYRYIDSYKQSRTIENFQLTAVSMTIIYTSIIILVIETKFKRKRVQVMVNVVDKITEEMEAIGLPKQHWVQYKYQMWSLFIFTAYFAFYVIAMWCFKLKPTAPLKNKILLSLGACMPQNTTMAVQLSFSIWIRHIGSKFGQLNKLLKEMIEALERPKPRRFLDEIDDRWIERRTRNDLLKDLHKIAIAKKCHLDLVRVAKSINKFYGKQLVLISLVAIILLIVLLFILNYIIWNPPPMVDIFSEVFPPLVIIFIIWMRIVHLHSNCTHTTNEAKAAGFLLCRLYDSSTSTKFRAEVQNFTQQVLQTPLVFSVCGLVDFDRSFLPSLAGSLFAYLFVIVQLASTQWYFMQESAANATVVNSTLIIDN